MTFLPIFGDIYYSFTDDTSFVNKLAVFWPFFSNWSSHAQGKKALFPSFWMIHDKFFFFFWCLFVERTPVIHSKSEQPWLYFRTQHSSTAGSYLPQSFTTCFPASGLHRARHNSDPGLWSARVRGSGNQEDGGRYREGWKREEVAGK